MVMMALEGIERVLSVGDLRVVRNAIASHSNSDKVSLRYCETGTVVLLRGGLFLCTLLTVVELGQQIFAIRYAIYLGDYFSRSLYFRSALKIIECLCIGINWAR